MVAGGTQQVYGKDYDSVYAPVVDFALTLLTLCLCLPNGWDARHVDVKAAFLNGDVDRNTYVRHPYNLPKEMTRNDIYKPLNALYGLRQATLVGISGNGTVS